MSGNANSLDGTQRAALVLLALDEEIATEVMRHLSEEDLRRLAACSASPIPLPVDRLNEAFEDFDKQMSQVLLPHEAGQYMRRLASIGLGEARAQKMFAPAVAAMQPIDTLKSARVSTLADLLGEEHPQVAAVIISQLPKEQAAKVLSAMPQETQTDLLGRIAALEEIPGAIVQLASEALAKALAAAGGIPSESERKQFDGVAFTASLLNELAPDQTDRLLTAIGDTNERLAPKIREAMFTFEDLRRLDSRALQQLMKEVPTEQLLVALKTASEDLREHFLKTVSSRAAAAMREDLAAMPPTRVSDVEKGQRSIVEVALRLAGEGRIVLPGSSSEKLV